MKTKQLLDKARTASEKEVRKILVLPSAFHKEHPLYVGYVGNTERKLV